MKREHDIIDYIYGFFLGIDKSLKEKYIGSFSDSKFKEPNVWDGTRMHTFYSFNTTDKVLHIAADKEVSTFETIYVGGKFIPSELRDRAEKSCADWRTRGFLFCKTVEEVVLSLFSDTKYPRQLDAHFPFSYRGIEKAVEEFITLTDTNS